MNDQHHNLRLLGIFHFVFAGVVFLASLLPLVWLLLAGLWWPAITEGGDGMPLLLTGTVAAVGAGFYVLLAWSLVAALVVSGRNLLAESRFTFCLVVAAVSCLLFPLGTILGVSTIMVVNREQIRRAG